MVGRGEIPHASSIIDTLGRKQPLTKKIRVQVVTTPIPFPQLTYVRRDETAPPTPEPAATRPARSDEVVKLGATPPNFGDQAIRSVEKIDEGMIELPSKQIERLDDELRHELALRMTSFIPTLGFSWAELFGSSSTNTKH